MVKEFADSAPGVGERRDVLFAESRFREKVFGAINEPGEIVPLCYDTVGKLNGCFAAGANLRQVGDCNRVEFLVDGCNAFAQPIDLRLQAADSAAPFLWRRPLDDCLDFPDRALELPQALALVRQDRNGEWLYLLGQLIFQNGESGFAARHDKHAFARGHGMADQVGDRMCFAGARRSLNDKSVRLFEAPDQLDLIVVVGFREEYIEGRFVRRL
jgi:hypothetical protein